MRIQRLNTVAQEDVYARIPFVTADVELAEASGAVTSEARLASVAWFEKAASANPYAVETIETLRWAYEFERGEASRLRNMALAASYNEKATALFSKTEELVLQGEPKE